ncbi:MAG TPA: sensor histidine kinase [Chthonomonadaceae bacterium]|nr:sensor histidine kinase [Chthonomonadaceae bacterium]
MTQPSRFLRRPDVPRRDLQALWQINKYLWMTLAFLLVYLPIARWQGILKLSGWQAAGLFALALLDGGTRSYLAYRRGGFLPDLWAWCFTGLDILLLSCAVHFTGGLQSDLWLVYFVVLIFESLYATPLQKRLLNIAITLAYLAAALPTQYFEAPLPWPAFARIFLSRLFFLILTSSLARRISRNVQERDRELSLLREQMATAEERGRIAREVHDGLGHALVSIILRLELSMRLIRKAPEEAEAILKEEIPALRSAWNEGRDLAFHLRPWESGAGDESLTEMLRRHIGRFAERTGLRVDFKVTGSERKLGPAETFGLTRIVQEALTNAAKHAEATSIEVLLAFPLRSGVVCTVRDNGVGFVPEERRGGFGLQAMRDRAEALGGSLSFESAPGSGVEIIVTLP